MLKNSQLSIEDILLVNQINLNLAGKPFYEFEIKDSKDVEWK